MRKRNTLAALVVALSLLAPTLASPVRQPPAPRQQPARPTPAQTPTPTPSPSPSPAEEDGEDEVVRISTNLVQFDTVVVDKDGRQVTDLKPEDFEVLIDGKPQTIANFSYVSTESGTVSTQRVAPRAGPAVAGPPPPPVRLRPEQVRRTVALVVDDLGTSFESTAHVRRALKKFVDEQMQPGDLVAIMRTSAGIGALQQFTGDKQLLYKAIERVRWYPSGRSGVSAFAPLEADPLQAAGRMTGADRGGNSRNNERDRERQRTADEALSEFREEIFSVGTLGALNFIIRGMRELPGRKAVVFFSDGFRVYFREDNQLSTRVLEGLRRLSDLANRAAVTVYTVDARGLVYMGLSASDNTANMSADDIERELTDRRTTFIDTQAGMEYLARQTGGAFMRNTNDLGLGIRRALEDQKGYYLIGFHPPPEVFDAEAGRPRFNRFEVRLRRAGLETRARRGFYGFTEETARPVRRTRAEQMIAALTSPFTSGGLDLKLTTLFSSPVEQATIMDSLLHLNMRQFKFADEADGWKKAVVDVMAITFGENGQVIDQINRTETVRARGDALNSVLDNGLVYLMRVPVKKAGAYQLRVAVRDAATEKLGSASQFIEVPNLKKSRLALSGIFLTSTPPAAAAPPPAAAGGASAQEGAAGEDTGLRDAALRRFPRGASLDFTMSVYNAALDRATGRPQVQLQTRLYREGVLAYEGKPMPIDVSQQRDLKRLVFASRLKLGAALPPGEYVLQVVATDAVAGEKKGGVATQWIDFELVR